MSQSTALALIGSAATPLARSTRAPTHDVHHRSGVSHILEYNHFNRGFGRLALLSFPTRYPHGGYINVVVWASSPTHRGQHSDIHGCWFVDTSNHLHIIWNCLGSNNPLGNYVTDWVADAVDKNIFYETMRYRNGVQSISRRGQSARMRLTDVYDNPWVCYHDATCPSPCTDPWQRVRAHVQTDADITSVINRHDLRVRDRAEDDDSDIVQCVIVYETSVDWP